ncbi:FeoB-associated Cys-rich membrane protein [Persephonella sp.]|nr:FeoB-associated Cys-rich membrane protein [Aquificota bacterium]
MEYLIVGTALVIAVYYLYRKFRKEIKKGQCASCPLYDECSSKDKV